MIRVVVILVLLMVCCSGGVKRSGVSEEYRIARGELVRIGFANFVMYAGQPTDSVFSIGYYNYGNIFYPVSARHIRFNSTSYTVVSVTRDSLILVCEEH